MVLSMERINRILNHNLFIRHLHRNEEAEREREFCRHDMGHFLDVARLAVILNLKEEQKVEEELLYAAALLHDIGRHVQYEDETPHETASARLAQPILKDCGFDGEEAGAVTDAILSHRKKEAGTAVGLTGLLYRADKLSRSCFACKEEKKCNWKQDKKNLRLMI